MSTLALADTGHSHGAGIGEPAKAYAATRTVHVELGDIFYEPKTIQVQAGETVRFVLKNTGQLLHDFTIGTAEMHAEHQKEMLAMMESGLLNATGIETDMTMMENSEIDSHS